jgi:hypothetical protein
MAIGTALLADEDIRDAWALWEQPTHISDFLMDWIEMALAEKVAFFYAMVLPETCGPVSREIPLQRVLDLHLVSRYPSRSANTAY